jgi:hypothetical protein
MLLLLALVLSSVPLHAMYEHYPWYEKALLTKLSQIHLFCNYQERESGLRYCHRLT